jgi:hypothetical protein
MNILKKQFLEGGRVKMSKRNFNPIEAHFRIT